MTKRERHNARMREDRKKHGDKRRAADRAAYDRNAERVYRQNIRRRYGLTEEQVDYVLAAAQCDICGDFSLGRKFTVDHCHDTGKVRGVLCLSCNVALGQFKDDPERLRAALLYLQNGGSDFFGRKA